MACSASATGPTPRPSTSAASASMTSSPSWSRSASASASSTTPPPACCPKRWTPNGARAASPRQGKRPRSALKYNSPVEIPRALDLPRDFNAADDLVGRNLQAGRAGKTAYIDDAGQCTFGELAERVDRFGSHLLSLGLRMEDRILIAMHDSIDWPVAFLGAIKAGIVPVAVNTLLTPKDYEYMLADSRAKALLVSAPLKAQFEPFLSKLPFLKHVLVSP